MNSQQNFYQSMIQIPNIFDGLDYKICFPYGLCKKLSGLDFKFLISPWALQLQGWSSTQESPCMFQILSPPEGVDVTVIHLPLGHSRRGDPLLLRAWRSDQAPRRGEGEPLLAYGRTDVLSKSDAGALGRVVHILRAETSSR